MPTSVLLACPNRYSHIFCCTELSKGEQSHEISSSMIRRNLTSGKVEIILTFAPLATRKV